MAQDYPSSSPYVFVLNTPIQAIDPDGKRIYYVGKLRKKEMRAYKRMLKSAWGKAVYKTFAKNDYNDIYIKVASSDELFKREGGNDYAGLTLYKSNQYFENASWPWQKEKFKLKSQYKDNKKAELWGQEFNGVEMKNPKALTHFIVLNPNMENLDKVTVNQIAETLLHEMIAHVWIPLLRKDPAGDVDREHALYGSEGYNDYDPGSIGEDVHKDIEKVKSEGSDYDPGNVDEKTKKVEDAVK